MTGAGQNTNGDLVSTLSTLASSVVSYISMGNKLLFEDHKTITGIVGSLIILFSIFGIFSYESNTGEVIPREELQATINFHDPGGVDIDNLFKDWKEAMGTFTKSGHSDENTESQFELSVTDIYLTSMTVTLTWTDEPNQKIWLVKPLVNQPDEFGLTIGSPQGASLSQEPVANADGEQGEVTLVMEIHQSDLDEHNGTGSWTITVNCGNCGDQQPNVGFMGKSDTGNDWQVNIEWTYLVEE